MRFTRIVALFLTLAVPCAATAQQSKKPRPNSRTTPAPRPPRPTPSVSAGPSRMSPEKAFYYFVAMYGFGRVLRDGGGPDDIIDIYGKSFDASNYARAMADEFERGRYKERIRARIADEVRKVDFDDKFTFVGEGTLGEYSFGSHSFPVVRDKFQWYQFCIGPQGLIGQRCEFLDVTAFRAQDAVNRNDFNWSLPMSESDASAFVKSRSTGRGDVDRRIAVRITYSVTDEKKQGNPYFQKSFPIFIPFIYSVEVYGDKSLTAKLGVIPKINSLGPSTAEELRLATVAAQTPTKEIGRYAYLSGGRDYPPEAWGTITLTDVGLELSGEQPYGRPQKQTTSFYQVFQVIRGPLYFWRSLDRWWIEVTPQFVGRYNGSFSTLEFRTQQDRDRFFVDLEHALQEWKTKYASLQFAAGKVTFDQRCESGGHFFPCSE